MYLENGKINNCWDIISTTPTPLERVQWNDGCLNSKNYLGLWKGVEPLYMVSCYDGVGDDDDVYVLEPH
jgi:hypothetical protein